MAKKAKEESLNLFYLEQNNKPNKSSSKKSKSNSKNQTKKANKKVKEQKTKEEKFDFNDEIVIGLARVEQPTSIKATEKKKKRAEKISKQHKQKKEQQRKKEEILVEDIYSKQNYNENSNKKGQAKKQTKKQPKKLTKQQEIAIKKRKIVFKVIRFFTLIVIIIGGTIYALMSPIFNIKNIVVEGNSKVTEQEVISLSKIETEQNMFRYKKSKVISNIKEEAYIEKVKVQRKLPDEIKLVVTERKATFMLAVANANAYINNQGYVLEITSENSTLPLLKGISTPQEQIQPGNRLSAEDLEKLGDVLNIMESATSNGIANLITQIDITNKNDYILRLSKNKKTVYLGDISNLSTKMLWIITFNEKEKNTEGDIILNINLNSERPYFRKKV